jgi:hypothetical protein
VLRRTVVLRGSSGFLNTRSCSFHLFAARETRVGGRVVLGRTSVLCYTGWSLCNWKLGLPSSWCWNIQEVGASIQLVLEYSRSWFFLLVGARETRELVLSNKLHLVKQR